MKRSLSIASLILGSVALCLALFAFSETKQEEQDPFILKLEGHIQACLDYNKEITKKEDISFLLKELSSKNGVLETGSDDLRVKFVNLQGCIEHAFACSQALGEITSLIGVIHTPMVATPLCTKPEGPISEGLLDASIRYDLDKLLTVRSRAQIVREYLMKGGKLYIVYPQGGLEKRTAEQQQIYQEELKKHPHQLFDWVLNCSEIDPNMIGATYLFKNQQGKVFAFSIKARQANDIQPQAEWGLWLGEIENPIVAKHVNELFDYLVSCEGPDLRTYF